MISIFNSSNFNVNRGVTSTRFSKLANIPYVEFEYGMKIKYSGLPSETVIKPVRSSFGLPSHIIEGIVDGPVYCWAISSHGNREIIYIEYWKSPMPARIYIFFNIKNNITSSFLKYLYTNIIRSNGIDEG